MSVVEPQPMSVNDDGWWSGGAHSVISSLLAGRDCPGHALAYNPSSSCLDLRTGPEFLMFLQPVIVAGAYMMHIATAHRFT